MATNWKEVKKKRQAKDAKKDFSNQFYTRILHRAYLRDGDITYTGEALALAMLLHAKGKTDRGAKEVEQIGKMLDDPNLPKTA